MVVAQLVGYRFRLMEVLDSNPVCGKFYVHCVNCIEMKVLSKADNMKRSLRFFHTKTKGLKHCSYFSEPAHQGRAKVINKFWSL